MLLNHKVTDKLNNRAIRMHHESLEQVPTAPFTQTEINRFFRQHDQRTCHMGTYTALISKEGCDKIKKEVKKFMRNKGQYKCSTDVMYNAVVNYAEYCPKCRYYTDKKKKG